MRLIVVSFLCVLIALAVLKKTNMKAELNYVSKQTVKPNAQGWQIGVNVKATMSLFTFALSNPPISNNLGSLLYFPVSIRNEAATKSNILFGYTNYSDN